MSEISSEHVAKAPPGSRRPLSLQFSPDGKLLTYLFRDENSDSRQLFSVDCSNPSYKSEKMFDVSKDASVLSHEEALRRERMRLFGSGVASYEWSGDSSEAQKVMIPFNGKILMVDPNAQRGSFRLLYDDTVTGPCIDPHMSPDNSAVAFVLDDNLWVQHLSKTETDNLMPVRLTENGTAAGIQCGAADYIAQEEMDRYRGYWWSPNSKYIAYTETDENAVQEYQILHQGKSDPRHTETHRYPFVGAANPVVKLAVLAVPEAGNTAPPDYIWMDLIDPSSGTIDPQDYYLGRVGWWPDETVMAQVTNREQTCLELLRLDKETGKRQVLLRETSKYWINLHDLLWDQFPSTWTHDGSARQPGDFYFLWMSERDGFMQLYFYQYKAASAECVVLLGGKPIGGGGDFAVMSINAVDPTDKVVYFTANKGNHTEKHLFRASFASEEESCDMERLTGLSGTHDCAVSVSMGLIADVYSSTAALPSVTMWTIPTFNKPSERLAELLGRDRSHPYPSQDLLPLVPLIVPPTIEVILSADNRVDLYCAVYRPDPAVHGHGPYPCIMSVYGGPHVMRVTDSWSTSADLRAQRFAKLGYVVIKCDNRGSFYRGIAFEGALKYDMGNIEVIDQQTAVEYFVNEGLVDPKRVGMFGWSYGGYMSAMSLCRAPDTFCCSVAGAPVTSWDGYDTHYTERYMGTPKSNPKGYEESSVMTYVSKMKGNLLLVHGLIDENVHFRHTARLINALIEHRKHYDLVLFPCERHAPHKEQDRIYLEDRMLDFIVKHMPPNDTEEIHTILCDIPVPPHKSPKAIAMAARAAGAGARSSL